MKANYFDLTFNRHGALTRLIMNDDPHHTNWVMDPDYLEQAGYQDTDKLFGEFDLTVDGRPFSSIQRQPSVRHLEEQTIVTYRLDQVTVQLTYSPGPADTLDWSVALINRTTGQLPVRDFGVWASLAYVMFRDKNVMRNMADSAAVFPSVSADFTKLAAVRRSNEAPHLGLYQIEGRTLSVGTYCDYTNLFFENISPSLDGMLFHKLMLAGGYPEGKEPSADWIYSHETLRLVPGETKTWTYRFAAFSDKSDFYARGLAFGHPIIDFDPLVNEGARVQLNVTLPDGQTDIRHANVSYKLNDRLITEEVGRSSERNGRVCQLNLPAHGTGEHKVTITLSNGKEDSAIFNVVASLRDMVNDRTDYISETLYQGADADVPYSFLPLSNQGESLGKLSLVLQKNLIDRKHLNVEQVRQVELSAVYYIRPKWFIDGDFYWPKKLYGNFYRVMDFEYIGHVFFLLSQFDDETLGLHRADDYLRWAADIFNLRVNADLHEDPRAKEETQMLGVFFLYIDDLLAELKKRGFTEKYHLIKEIWRHTTDKVNSESRTYKAAMTEHYYDNAGFGPAAGALSASGHSEGARRYSRLLEANIGFSNDFRAQSPDRWWEALSYMIHSLWGGVSSAAMLQAYDFLKDPAYLEAAYRSTVAILYCYDTDATATANLLEKGEAASTYSIAGPHLNRPDLSRNRFGQSTFAQDGGIFSRLFPDGDTGFADWDMGEELVAWLNGFGKKTYLYKQNGRLKAVNGRLEENSDGSYTVISYAPYPSEYIFYEDGVHYTAPPGTFVPVIKLADHRFVVE